MTGARYVPSRYLSLSHQDDGSLALYCARTGAIGVVPAEDAAVARRALLPATVTSGPLEGIFADLETGGFLVPAGTDEAGLVHEAYLQRYTDPSLHLIVLPTEQCNFRCVYCYESFLRNTMSTEIQDGLRKFVARDPALEHLSLDWFGGEPFVAREVVLENTRFFKEHCESSGISFTCGTCTNGYLLTPDYADQVIAAGLTNFQITLDGVSEEHDKRRLLQDGGRTFEVIWDNLCYLRSTDYDFDITIRHNFDPDTIPRLPEFLDMIANGFASDSRFSLALHAVGKWGGPNDAALTTLGGRDTTEALRAGKRLAIERGLQDRLTLQSMQPDGYVCYAANPRSFVIGPEGRVYKCTVELDYHDRNIVGQLKPDGTMDLDWRKMALWCETDGMEEGKKCTSCYFAPACHGAVCPKEWMDGPECGCPPTKHMIKDTLTLICAESLFVRPEPNAVSACAK
jgi:uncharacterized protein